MCKTTFYVRRPLRRAKREFANCLQLKMLVKELRELKEIYELGDEDGNNVFNNNNVFSWKSKYTTIIWCINDLYSMLVSTLRN